MGASAGVVGSRASIGSRVAVAAYGIVAYGIFLAFNLWAVGFLADAVWPKTIDSGKAGPWLTAVIVDAALLGVFAVQHSVMARAWFKGPWRRLVPAAAERSTFVLLASTILLLVLWQWQPLPATIWRITWKPAELALVAAYLAGWVGAAWATFLVDHADLFGLRQTLSFAAGRPYVPPAFKANGPYAIVRHPLMLTLLVVFWATPRMTVGHLLFALLATGYILVGTTLEERGMRRYLGAEYEAYARRVPALLPVKLGRRSG